MELCIRKTSALYKSCYVNVRQWKPNGSSMIKVKFTPHDDSSQIEINLNVRESLDLIANIALNLGR